MWPRHGERRRASAPGVDGAGSAAVPTPYPADDAAADADRIDQLIHDVRDLRTILALDLSAAAGAADAGADDVVADIVDADRAAVADLVARAARLTAIDRVIGGPLADSQDSYDDADPAIPGPREPRTRRVSRLLPAAPLAVAAAVIAAVATGALQAPSRPVTVHSQPVAASWHRFTLAAGSDDAQQLMAAAEQLHQSLAAYIDSAGDDPTKAREAMKLLQLEQQLLLREHPPGMDLILAQSQQLIAALQTTLAAGGVPDLTGAAGSATTTPQVTRTSTRLTAPVVKAPATRTRATATTQPKPATSAAPKPTASPSASPSASPTPSPTNPFPLPSSPGEFFQ